MAIIISRLFDDRKHADAAADQLAFNRLPERAVRVITAGSGEDKEAIAARLAELDLAQDTASSYAEHLAQGKTALVVHTTHKPLGAAQITRDVLKYAPTVDTGDVSEENYVKDAPGGLSILDHHPRFLTSRSEVRNLRRSGPVSHGLGPKLLIRKRKADSAMRGGGFMSRYFWPMPLLKSKRSANSAIKGGKHVSRAFWPMALVSRKSRNLSVIRGGRLMLTSPSNIS